MAGVLEDATNYTKCDLLTDQSSRSFLFHLREQVKKSPREIIDFILDYYSDFLSLLKESNEESINLAITVLGRMCSDESFLKKHFKKTMESMSSDNKRIFMSIQKHLASLHKQPILEEHHLDGLLNLRIFLKTFQLALPSPSFNANEVSIMLPLISDSCEKLIKQHEELHNAVSGNTELVADRQQRHFVYKGEKLSESEKLHMLEPPQNFRSLPILPTVDDVCNPCLFLRPNLTKGRYKDTEHYLDVQFRLLREDYIKPLRDGIVEYLSAKKSNNSLRTITNVRVYTNVCIRNEEFIDGNLMHNIHFQEKHFTQINWKSSERLLTGNILCLSTDDFSTMLFATVVERNLSNLKKGFLLVRFEEVNEAVLSLNFSSMFVVIEVPALFEAYRHNLKALQLLNEQSLPMKNYIVDLENSIKQPSYLLSSTIYDMRPLFFPLKQGCIGQKFLSFVRKNSNPVNDRYKSIKVVDDNEWPSASEINLDKSQYLALKSAITKEFAIIQGPPGTGKTYIGLRTVQILLHNISSWFRDDPGTLPILVVCYTNHALDQFLEGILMLTKKIVRIGGRGSNETVSKFQIRRLKEKMNIPFSIRAPIRYAKQKIEFLKTQINNFNKFLARSKDLVVSESVLQEVIPPAQFSSLTNHRDIWNVSSNMESTSKENIYDWLEINTFGKDSFENNFYQEKFQFSDSSEVNDEPINENEADVEFIENQRNVDYYDFKDRRILRTNDEPYAESRDQAKADEQKIVEYVRNSLQINPTMTTQHALEVKNVWNLPINERWQLYKFWYELFLESQAQEYLNAQEQLKSAIKEFSQARIEEDLFVIDTAHVIGMTTTGAAKYRHIIEARNPVVLIVEEAAEILECHIVASLAPKTEHVILIGDQQQLRPSPSVYMLAVKYGMDVSLFERMINNGIDFCRLSLQHRMRPEIACLIAPHIYDNLENHESVTGFENIKGIAKNVFFVDHSFNEAHVQYSKTKINDHEVTFILKLCKYLILQGYDPSNITVLTTYSGQLFALKKLATDCDVKKVRFTVVDSYQGEENDIILISFVRSNKKGEVGFLKVSNRICVALSRAKKGLYCIGNFTLLEQKSDVWKNIIQTLNANKSIGTSLRLVCQNHPDRFTDIVKGSDFKTVPEGGCGHKCEYRLHCGHSCTRYCHPDDTDHLRFQCMKPCMTVCEQGHGCPRICYKNCQPCPTNVEKTLSKCGHTVTAWCGINEDKIKCQKLCKNTCEAGHPCPKKCFEDCGQCTVIIDRFLSLCNHTVRAECGKNEDEIICQEPCIKSCKAGHPCPKMCFEQCGSCKVIIDRFLLQCKHTVKAACGKEESDIVCEEVCNKVCSKGHPCLKECFEVCGECEVKVNKTLPTCGHVVNVLCSLPEELIRCENQCEKTCSKGHLCQKFCYETCGSCDTVLDRALSCGHTVKAACSKHEHEIKCFLQCERKLPCSHKCENRCYEPCTEKCLKPVKVKLPKCGHSLKVACHSSKSVDEFERKCVEPCKDILPCGHICTGTCDACEEGTRHVLCQEACRKVLNCGHNCVKKCSEPCAEQCKKIIQLQSPVCNHLLNIECALSNIPSNLSKKCVQPCATVLPCGHTCKGTCGSCYQGRLHGQCNESCNRTLLCGHKCESKCCKSCPPCEKPCENKCSHGKCPRKCGYPCLNCTKPCKWVCSHKKCTRQCYEVCDREPCNERCPKQLQCNHQCIGFCGEPCPKECIICNNGENLLDLKDGNFAGYVYLEDCKHSFREHYLRDWFSPCSSEMQRIFMKTCPKCKTVVRTNFRFNQNLKNDAQIIEKIKLITKWDKEKNLDIQRTLLQRVNSSHYCRIFYKQVTKLLSGGSIRCIFELTSIKCILSFMEDIESKSITYSPASRSILEEILNYYHYCKEWVTDYISKNFIAVSEYQLQQLSREIHRLHLLEYLLKFAESSDNAPLPLEFEKCSSSLMVFAPVTDINVECFKKSVECFVKNLNDVPLKLNQPLYIISMSGNWYQCSKGHIICISSYDETAFAVCWRCKESTNSFILESGACVEHNHALNETNCSAHKGEKTLMKHVVSKFRSATTDRDQTIIHPSTKTPSPFMRISCMYKHPSMLYPSEKKFSSNIYSSSRNILGASENIFSKNNHGYGKHRNVSRSLSQANFFAGNKKQLTSCSGVQRNHSSRVINTPRHPVASSSRNKISDKKVITDAAAQPQSDRKTKTSLTKQSSISELGDEKVSDPHRRMEDSKDASKQPLSNGVFHQGSKKNIKMHKEKANKCTKNVHAIHGRKPISESTDNLSSNRHSDHRIIKKSVKTTEFDNQAKAFNDASEQSSSNGVFEVSKEYNMKTLDKENLSEISQNKQTAWASGRKVISKSSDNQASAPLSSHRFRRKPAKVTDFYEQYTESNDTAKQSSVVQQDSKESNVNARNLNEISEKKHSVPAIKRKSISKSSSKQVPVAHSSSRFRKKSLKVTENSKLPGKSNDATEQRTSHGFPDEVSNENNVKTLVNGNPISKSSDKQASVPHSSNRFRKNSVNVTEFDKLAKESNDATKQPTSNGVLDEVSKENNVKMFVKGNPNKLNQGKQSARRRKPVAKSIDKQLSMYHSSNPIGKKSVKVTQFHNQSNDADKQSSSNGILGEVSKENNVKTLVDDNLNKLTQNKQSISGRKSVSKSNDKQEFVSHSSNNIERKPAKVTKFNKQATESNDAAKQSSSNGILRENSQENNDKMLCDRHPVELTQNKNSVQRRWRGRPKR